MQTLNTTMASLPDQSSRSTPNGVTNSNSSKDSPFRNGAGQTSRSSSIRSYRVGSLRMGRRRNTKPSSQQSRSRGADAQSEVERSASGIGLGIIGPPTLPPPYTLDPPSTGKEKASSNFAEKFEDKILHYSSSGNWALEIISWLISALCMLAIIGILVGVQNRRMPKWALGFTLNALAKIASAALVLPASEALGQLKWMWFGQGKSKTMMDFEVFDNASRGPWGSVLLLIRTRGRSLAALGALVTLLALALDPFFQQLASFPGRWTLQGSSGIPKVTTFVSRAGIKFQKGMELAIADLDMQSVVEKFFFDNGTQPVLFGNTTRSSAIPISCPTSNCTWPPYGSLSVCSACEDVSYLLEFACLHGYVDFYEHDTESPPSNGTMCGYFVNATTARPILASGYVVNMDNSSQSDGDGRALIMRAISLVGNPERERRYNTGSINFAHIRHHIADFILATASNGPSSVYRNETPVALECMLSWCVKTFNSSYYWANYQEDVIDEVFNTTQGPNPWSTVPFGDGFDTYYHEDITIMDQNHIAYGLSNVSHFNIALIFDEILPSWTYVKDATAPPRMVVQTHEPEGPFHRIMNLNPWLAPNNITNHVERLAKGMTNIIRSTSSEMVSGLAFNQETFVSVEWAWISVPLLVLILCGAFLASTIWRSSRDKDSVGGVWKNSALGTLIHGLPDELQKDMRASRMTDTPRTVARTLKVKIHPKNGWRVSGDIPVKSQNQPPPGWI